ncbi:hypothetical protein SAMN05216421_1650 [Halopseudomonas xinjiangensis]|uniref:Uncharacterized protein n=1 Tax=Halopseudomonas xinjiangensis TaxID=487184 RepID=A0A1H1SRZ0_9GAMM|nr:hypothetical protein [Halopseudomonas xinjiangensis]SDS50695.1 hypothetical protein SAMN05216421_1650 [Halopseudomonas xinjiangensis]
MHNPDAEDQRNQSPPKEQEKTERDKDDRTTTTEEELDETIDESFPASDPPANY